MIAGKGDALLTPELLRATVVDRMLGARLDVLDCGHEIPIERPAEAAGLMDRASAEARAE